MKNQTLLGKIPKNLNYIGILIFLINIISILLVIKLLFFEVPKSIINKFYF